MSHCPNCGTVIEHARSGPDHRRFFALISAAFTNWPEHHEHQPANEEVLRAYLLIRAGHIDVVEVEIPTSSEESEAERARVRAIVEGACRAVICRLAYYEMRVGDRALQIISAKSIDYATVRKQREFNGVREAVELIIEDALGRPAEQILKARAA